MADYNFGMNEPPHRRWPVAWYNPLVLLRSARELMASADQIRNFDRRELYQGEFEVVDLSGTAGRDDFWWDFVSDMGDSGNATYAVARAVLAPAVVAPQAEACGESDWQGTFPRGDLLVLGGDLAYPGACTEEYQYRFVEMWEGARPDDAPCDRTVLAIPQNHDWFDNISTFHRYFVKDHQPGFGDPFLAAETPQQRSYFAARLPRGWWLFGFDFALVGDLDRGQFEAFCGVVKSRMRPGDDVILLYPEPYWTRPLGDEARPGYPKRYQRLEALLLEREVRIRIRLAGDLHHYVREQAESGGAGLEYDDALVTCGCGGAFLHPTHANLAAQPKRMDRRIDAEAMTDDLKGRVRLGTVEGAWQTWGHRAYGVAGCYPDQATSRRLVWGNLLAMFKPAGELDELCGRSLLQGNLMFSLLLGLLYWAAVYCNSFVFSASFLPDGFVPSSRIGELPLSTFLGLWVRGLFFSPLAMGVHVLLVVLCGAIAREDGWRTMLSGMLLGVLHVLAAATLYWWICGLVGDPFVRGLVLTAFGTLVGGLLFGTYFACMSWLGCLGNNAFSPVAYQGYKGFLRFRIDRDGNLHGYMLGTDSVPRRWRLNPDPRARRPVWVERDADDLPDWQLRDAFTLRR
ncbi:hypothetical protein [Chitinimonas koreensis]|uniref:hypothetical protein n=1 Tax=Chitinimonas koreensis TaxID=356302 RepID=UPI000412336F|nr:hypothetical protein [Chitinimonas koreensis]QNM98326.1 hypothetical protein H9L41_08860 [Chitinimonas koreensis]